ncbi:MAG: hypothetical protein K6T90_15710 [Leptolyngbyaceae cyanobacterium HOT.MB2.61]|jgi:hypothetical protein|nr:hypothetical protein [Leptolyngbyaceae cyanobacterium HOT.MB2.61]
MNNLEAAISLAKAMEANCSLFRTVGGSPWNHPSSLSIEEIIALLHE